MKKKILLSAAFIAFVLIGLAQVPDAFNYQAVVRSNSGEVVANQNVSFKISILQGSESGMVLYAETHSISTNAFGLINLKVGNGTLLSGVFSPGGWGATSHFLKVEIDPAGGSTYTHLGTSELLSVPYAFHAKTVEDDAVDDADASPTNELQALSLIGTDLTLSEGGGTVTLPAPVADDWGTQTVASDATLSGDGTSGDPMGVVGDLTDDQTLSLAGNDLTISEGNTITLPGDDWGAQAVESDATLSGVGTSGEPLGVVGDLTDDQTLSIVGDELSISEGNTVTLPGDNWGAQVVESDGTLSGIGTSGDPLSVNGDLSDDQTLSLAGDNLSISNGNSVNLGGTDDQTLSVAGSNLSISNGNTVAIPSIWNTNGSNVFYDGGNVGIGTSTPGRQLNILGGTGSHVSFQNTYTGHAGGDGLLVGIEQSTNRAYVFNYENGPLRLGANGVTRFQVHENGNVGVGYTGLAPTRILDLHGGPTHGYMMFHTNASGSGNTDGLLVGISDNGLSTYFHSYENGNMYFATAGTTRMTILGGGNIGIGTIFPDQALTVSGNASKSVGGAFWATFSDRRLKDLHGSYNKGLSEILALQPVVFNYKADNPLDLPSDNNEIGFIAQEVREIFPEAVSVTRSGYFDLNVNAINVALVNAVKELKAENDNLKDRVNILESDLAGIKKMLKQ